MSQDKNETLYDKTMRQLKNNPIVVIILVIGTVVVAFSQSLDIFKSIKNTVAPSQAEIAEASVAFQRFNSAGDYVGAPLLRSPMLSDPKDKKSVANDIVSVIVNEVQPPQRPSFQANLQINDGILTSDVAIAAYLIAVQSVQNQQGPRVETTDMDAGENMSVGENLSQRFTDPSFFNTNCNCINYELRAHNSGYEGVYLKIYRFHDGYSFNMDSMINRKTVEFDKTQIGVILLIETLQGVGASEDDLSTTTAMLEKAIRQQLQDIEYITLSPYKSQAEYQAEIENVISILPLGQGKQDYIEQQGVGVDYVVTITYIMK